MPDLVERGSGSLSWRQRLSRLRSWDGGSLIWRGCSTSPPMRSFLRSCTARCSCLIRREIHERLQWLLPSHLLLVSFLLPEGLCLRDLDVGTCIQQGSIIWEQDGSMMMPLLFWTVLFCTRVSNPSMCTPHAPHIACVNLTSTGLNVSR